MRQENLKYFDFYREGTSIDKILKIEEPDLSELEDMNPHKALLEAIYAPDPISGWPTGDIACYVSDKTSPAVKDFIKNNLMMDLSSAKLPAAPAGVDDDLLFALSRQKDEDVQSYASRVSRYYQSEVDLINSARSKVNVSSE